MGFNSGFKGLKLLKNPGYRCLNNLNDPVLNVLIFKFQMNLLLQFMKNTSVGYTLAIIPIIILTLLQHFSWPGSVVSIVTGYGLDGPGIESR
jgi:hypothetical protein